MTTIKGLRDIEPYVAGSQPSGENLIKLNTNENAYGPSPKVAEVFSHFNVHQLRKYSTLDQESLRVVLAKQHGLDPSQIIVGNGSDDVLSMAFLAFFNSDEPVLFPDLTYGFYKVWADLYRINYHEVPLTSDFEINGNDYIADNGGVVLTNPNAPTGIYKSLEAIEAIIKTNQDVVVIIDEAYINFGGETALPLLKKYDNVFITRTFSKELAEKCRYSAVAAVESWDYYEDTCQKIIATRDWFTKELRDLDFPVLESKTNFVLAECPQNDAANLFDYLQAKNIYVRYFPKVERIKNHLRISIGTQAEMERVIEAIKDYQKA